MQTVHPESSIWSCSKLAINWKNDNDITIYWNGIIVKYFWRCFFLLSSLVTGPSFMSISSLVLVLWQFSFIRDWSEIWKPEIPLPEFCPISGDRRSRDTKFGNNFSNKTLLNAAKCQGYGFYRFWVIKGKPTARGWGDGELKLPLSNSLFCKLNWVTLFHVGYMQYL